MMEVTYIDHMGTDLSVVNAARVSFDKRSGWVCAHCGEANWVPDYDYEHYCAKCSVGDDVNLSERDKGLINFLARNHHTSPFNHTFLTMHVRAPIYMARQLVKHKFMPWNEMSGRYVKFSPEFFVPKFFRKKATDKKQGSGGIIEDSHRLRLIFDQNHHDCFKRYEMALEGGLCEEQARSLLPVDLMTQWYWSGTLGAWANMYRLRNQPDAQVEAQDIAEQVGKIISPLYPYSWEALTA